MSKTHITHIENDNLGDGWLMVVILATLPFL